MSAIASLATLDVTAGIQLFRFGARAVSLVIGLRLTRGERTRVTKRAVNPTKAGRPFLFATPSDLLRARSLRLRRGLTLNRLRSCASLRDLLRRFCLCHYLPPEMMIERVGV